MLTHAGVISDYAQAQQPPHRYIMRLAAFTPLAVMRIAHRGVATPASRFARVAWYL